MKNKKQSLASQYIEDINKRQAKAAVLRQTNKLLLAEHKDTLRLVSEIKATAKPIEQALQTSLSVLEQHQQVRTQLIEIDDSHPPELLQQQFHIAGIKYDADQQNKMLSDALVATDEDIQKITASSLSYWRQIESLKQHQIAMLDHADHTREKLLTNKLIIKELLANPDSLVLRLRYLAQRIGTWLDAKMTAIILSFFAIVYVVMFSLIYPWISRPPYSGDFFGTAIIVLLASMIAIAALIILGCATCWLCTNFLRALNIAERTRQELHKLIGGKLTEEELKLLQTAKPS
ncbi:MAG: hypothetical protein K2X81_04195 [Candidatus Obscuribacterales bacterium]|jgi:hypothetical protein|nr:hypothetical protein [Candidatus Obscuribacterales bacterium]